MQTLAVLWFFGGTISLAATAATDRTPFTLRKVFVAYAVGPVAVVAGLCLLPIALAVKKIEGVKK